MDSVTIKWNRKRRFIGWDEAGHGVVMDATTAHHGDGSGARPLELVLYALGGCTGIDVVGILEKQRYRIDDFELHVSAQQREEQPKIYDKVHIEYVLTARGLDPHHVERAIRLSEDKYCSVRGMIAPGTEITSSYRIVEPE